MPGGRGDDPRLDHNAAFEAIAATTPLGSVAYEEIEAKGEQTDLAQGKVTDLTEEKGVVNVKQIIAVRDDLGMNRGKIAAQAAHASMLFLLDGLRDRRSWTAAESLWIDLSGRDYGGMKKVVVKVPDEASLQDLEARAETSGLTVKTVIDATLKCATCCAIGPDDEEKIDSVTGSLALLK